MSTKRAHRSIIRARLGAETLVRATFQNYFLTVVVSTNANGYLFCMSNTQTPASIETLAASGKLINSHTSLARGYVSRKSEGYVSEYSGKFGKGFVLKTPNFESTRFCYITYFIEA